jgi:DNA repair ATPase RecN
MKEKKTTIKQMENFVNSLRKTRMDVDIATAKLNNVVEVKKMFEASNLELEKDNKNLTILNKKLEALKANLVDDVNNLNRRIEEIDRVGEERVKRRLDEVESLAKQYRQAISDIEKERKELRSSLSEYSKLKKECDVRSAKLVDEQIALRVKADDIEKMRVAVSQDVQSWKNKMSDLKNEENRAEIIRLRVVKIINDNNNIKELESLRKELLG